MSVAYAAAAGSGDGRSEWAERLKAALSEALRREGFGAVTGATPSHLLLLQELTAALASALLLSVVFIVPNGLALSGWAYAGCAVGVVLGLFLILAVYTESAAGGPVEGLSARVLFGCLGASPLFAVRELTSSHPAQIFRTHFPAFAVVLSIWLFSRRQRVLMLLRSVPAFFPIIIGAPLISLFSADVWRVAGAVDARRGTTLAALAALVATLLWLLLARRLCNSVTNVFDVTARSLATEQAAVDDAAKRMDSLLEHFWYLPSLGQLPMPYGSSVGGPSGGPYDDYRRTVFAAAFGHSAGTYADLVCKRLERRFKRTVIIRFIFMVGSLGAGLWLFIYSIAALAVGKDVAASWTDRSSIVGHGIWNLGVDMPLGPYVVVAAFLSVAAMLIFLALALTKQEYAGALAETLLHRPIRDCLLFAIPYQHLEIVKTEPELSFNDTFDAAYQLTSAAGTRKGENDIAGKEPGEPDHAGNMGGKSVWFRWTPPRGGWATIDTNGSTFDTLLAVYRGSRVDALEVVAANDDFGDGMQSQVSFEAEAGSEYMIAVDGYGGRSGSYQLNWKVPPTNDKFEDAQRLRAEGGTIRGDNHGATPEPGEPTHAGSGGASVWYRWTSPTGGPAIVDTFGSTFDTVLAVYRGSSLRGLECVAENDDARQTEQSEVTFVAEPEVDYAIAVDGYAGTTGDIVLNYRLRPPNDAFANAEPLTGRDGRATGTNVGASREPGEPHHGHEADGKSVWYRWTAPEAGTVEIDTFGSDFDTVLAVYRGDRLDALECLAWNDDAPGTRQSHVTLGVERDATYAIAVDGYGLSAGAVVLNWALKEGRPPANDDFADAEELDGASGRVTAETRNATTERDEPRHAGTSGGRSVWYRWTPPWSGTATFDTFGSNFDTILAVYRGSALDALETVAENDDAPGRMESEVVFPAEAGVEYSIAVDGYNGASGFAVLSWRLERSSR